MGELQLVTPWAVGYFSTRPQQNGIEVPKIVFESHRVIDILDPGPILLVRLAPANVPARRAQGYCGIGSLARRGQSRAWRCSRRRRLPSLRGPAVERGRGFALLFL